MVVASSDKLKLFNICIHKAITEANNKPYKDIG